MSTPFVFSYLELLDLIEDLGLQYKALNTGWGMLHQYLSEEYKEPTLRFEGKEPYSHWLSTKLLSGTKIHQQITAIAKKEGMDVYWKRIQLNGSIMRTITATYLSHVFDVIQNYSKHHQGKLTRELYKTDWFKMLRVLRDNASHFYNMALPNPFPSGVTFKDLNEVSWNGVTIKRDQIGHTIKYSPMYAIELIQHCYDYLKKNEATLK